MPKPSKATACDALRAHGSTGTQPPPPPEPNVEIVEHGGLRWINIERPGPVDQAWLEEHFRVPTRSTTRTSARATSGRRSTPMTTTSSSSLHFPVVRQAGGPPQRGRGLDIFVRARTSWSRCRTCHSSRSSTCSSAAAAPSRRARSSSPRARATCSTRSVDSSFDYCFPMPPQDRQQARPPRGGDLRGPLPGGRARHLQRQAGDHQLPQDHPAGAPGAARPRAHQAALHGRGPRDLLRRHTSTRRSDSGTCSRTTRKSWRRSRTRTSR